MKNSWLGVVLFLALTACAAAVISDRGCAAYAIQRQNMPELGQDPVSNYLAELDTAMTGACK